MWSLDWFSASAIARNQQKVRRVGWDDRWLAYAGIWKTVLADGTERAVTADDFGIEDFNARDYTTEPFNADQCAATPAYNTTPPQYRAWTSEPIFWPPPIPGYAEAA